MATSNVTIEMVYDELRGVKDDLKGVKDDLKGVKDQSKGFTETLIDFKETPRDFKEDFKTFKYEVYNHFDQIAKRFERVENQQAEDHRILMELWKEKDNMKLSFTRTLLTVTGLTSGVIAFLVSLITGKAMIYRS